jgi:hypothetical protein
MTASTVLLITLGVLATAFIASVLYRLVRKER